MTINETEQPSSRACEHCEKEYEPRRRTGGKPQRFCSSECQSAAKVASRRAAALAGRLCAYCKEPFEPTFSQRLVCSSECRAGVENERRTAQLKEQKERYESDKDYKDALFATHCRNTYGITAAFYDWMLTAQGGVCASCHQPETTERSGKANRLSIDHNHDTDEVRGLLCFGCNTAEGKLKRDPAAILGLLRYTLGLPSIPLDEALAYFKRNYPTPPTVDLSIPCITPLRRLVWGTKAGPGEVSSFEVLTTLQALRDGGT
jgi:hypothetical protein